ALCSWGWRLGTEGPGVWHNHDEADRSRRIVRGGGRTLLAGARDADSARGRDLATHWQFRRGVGLRRLMVVPAGRMMAPRVGVRRHRWLLGRVARARRVATRHRKVDE